jgi:Flp pilus assembly protein TadG
MSDFFRRPGQAFDRFVQDETGSVVAEGVIILPLLIWAFIGLFVYWDAFREMNTVQKAGYTLSDALSREKKGVTNAYVGGMKTLFDYLVGDDNKANAVRVTSMTRNAATNKFEVHWSRSSNATVLPVMTTAKLQNYIAQIPSMSGNDYAMIVEVRVPYTPAFDVGLPDQVFTEFIVTRPRFMHCIAMDNVPCPVS